MTDQAVFASGYGHLVLTWPEPAALRRCALAVSVLHDIDMLPAVDGVVLCAAEPIQLSWHEICRALAGAEPDSEAARLRLHRWVLARLFLAEHPMDDLRERARPWASPVTSPLHPGMDWVELRVIGDAVDLGFGFVGIDPTDPDAVLPVPVTLLRAACIDPRPWWPEAYAYLERMGELATLRMQRYPDQPLKPMGDCDVVTLLGSRTLREALVRDNVDGLRAVAVPMRTRGWLSMRRVDPAFAATAASLTELTERGFERPLLLSRDEVQLAKEGGDVVAQALDGLAPVVPLRR